MAFTLDPAQLIGNAIQGVVGQPVVIGLPSPQALIPQFVIGIMPTEHAHRGVYLPSLQITAGDYFLKTALKPGVYDFELVLSQDPMLNNQQIVTIATALQQFTAVANTLAAFGGVMPNLSGLSSNYAVSQLSTLRSIMNNSQPILLLNAFTPLGAVSQNNPFLSSGWYIVDMDFTKLEADGGGIVKIFLEERLFKSSGILGALTNIANAVVGPSAGASMASLL